MAIGDDAIAAGMAIVAGTAQANTIDTEINRSRDYIAQRTSAVTPITKGGTGATTAAAARTNLGCAAASHTHTWSQITGIPATFAPSSHTHPWDQVTGKPSTFSPSAHTHDRISSGTNSLGWNDGRWKTAQSLGVGGFAEIGGALFLGGTPWFYNVDVVTSSYRAMYINGDGRVGVTPSARRYKKDIKPKAYGLTDAVALEVVNYRLRAAFYGDGEAPVEVGVIAEQLVEVGLSEYVIFNEDGSPESVAYERLALVALGALRDVAATLQEHDDRLAALEAKLATS